MEAIVKNVASVLLAYGAHYSATKFYSYMCVPDGILGFISGLVSTGSPVCQAGIHIISNTQVSYSSIIMTGITRTIVDVVAPKFTGNPL
jgi:hypothetical protein